jgi:regulator of replication initiation timing
MKTSKLNIFQNGIWQVVFSVGITAVFMLLGQFTFIYLYHAGLFSQQAIIVFFGLASALIVVAISFYIMKLTLGVNLATKVTLPKIVEFSHALKNIGINRFDEQIDFIMREKVFIFVSDDSILSPYKEKASVRRHIILKDKKKLKYLNGDKRLCLDADDYERLLEEHGAKTKSAYEARINELEQRVTELIASNSLHDGKIAKLTEDNEKLSIENAEYRNKQRTAPGRGEAANNREIRRIPFWRVVGPMLNRMIEEAQPDTEYTSTEIQATFDAEVKKYPELNEAIKQELHRYKQTLPTNEFCLDGWAMDSIRKGLDGFIQKDPRRPKKTK